MNDTSVKQVLVAKGVAGQMSRDLGHAAKLLFVFSKSGGK